MDTMLLAGRSESKRKDDVVDFRLAEASFAGFAPTVKVSKRSWWSKAWITTPLSSAIFPSRKPRIVGVSKLYRPFLKRWESTPFSVSNTEFLTICLGLAKRLKSFGVMFKIVRRNL